MTQTCTASHHLIDVTDLSSGMIKRLVERASYWESPKARISLYRNRFVANLFFEPSTRTRFSFEVAEKRLGMHVIDFDKGSSSMEKGESLYDTVKALSCIGAEAVVIRHSEANAILDLVNQDIGCAIINAGAGAVAHPTQALLDLYTIHKHFGRLEGLRVAIVGDIAHSRVAKSTLSILKKCGVEVVLSGPECMSKSNVWDEAPLLSLDEVLPKVDVVMLLRVQFERHEKAGLIDSKDYLNRYGLTIDRFKQMKTNAVIMHPGPVNKGMEIASELVEHPRSKIFKQMTNGVFVRMAALEYALGEV